MNNLLGFFRVGFFRVNFYGKNSPHLLISLTYKFDNNFNLKILVVIKAYAIMFYKRLVQ